MGNFIDLTGQQFGYLKVIKQGPRTLDNHITWECLCNCGNTTIVDGRHLRGNKIKSCGCLQGSNIVDIKGQVFGNLTVIEKVESRGLREHARWRCLCKCGRETIVYGTDLRSGATTTCGCKKESKGEQKIRELLEKEHWSFKQEVSFPDCLGYKKTRLRFDFEITHPTLGKVLVEFQGRQHYEYIQHFSKSKQKFNYARQMDVVKASYCLTRNIPLFAIPYWELDKLNNVSDIFNSMYKVKNRNHTLQQKPPKT